MRTDWVHAFRAEELASTIIRPGPSQDWAKCIWLPRCVTVAEIDVLGHPLSPRYMIVQPNLIKYTIGRPSSLLNFLMDLRYIAYFLCRSCPRCNVGWNLLYTMKDNRNFYLNTFHMYLYSVLNLIVILVWLLFLIFKNISS